MTRAWNKEAAGNPWFPKFTTRRSLSRREVASLIYMEEPPVSVEAGMPAMSTSPQIEAPLYSWCISILKNRQMQQVATGSTVRTSPWSTSRPSWSLHGISVLKFRKLSWKKILRERKNFNEFSCIMMNHEDFWDIFVNLDVNSRWFWVVFVWYVFQQPLLQM